MNIFDLTTRFNPNHNPKSKTYKTQWGLQISDTCSWVFPKGAFKFWRLGLPNQGMAIMNKNSGDAQRYRIGKFTWTQRSLLGYWSHAI